MGVSAGRSQAMQIQQGLIQVLLYEKGGLHSVLGFTPLILRWLLHVQEEGAAATLVLQFQETLRALALLLGQFAKKVTHTLQGHIVAVEIEALQEEMAGTMVSRRRGQATGLCLLTIEGDKEGQRVRRGPEVRS